MGDSLINKWSGDAIRRESETVAVSSSSAETIALKAAKPGYKYIITKVFLVAAGADGLTFKSGTTSKTGAIPLATNGILDIPDAWIVCKSGEAANLTKAQAVAVTGYVNIAAFPG